MLRRIITITLMTSLILPFYPASRAAAQDFPAVLSIRDRAEVILDITRKRLDQLIPGFMRQTGFDMWIIIGNEDNHDPVYETMIPYKSWCPITQIVVFFDRGPDRGVERLNISRTNLQGLYRDMWDYRVWDARELESQWDCLGRIVRERDPKNIGINVGEIQWAAGGLTAVLKNRLVRAIGPKYEARLESAEPLVTLWGETLLDEEIELFERAVAFSHALIAETFSSEVITPGYTTTDDLLFHYCQRVADLTLEIPLISSVSIRGRHPDMIKKYGKDDKVVRPGDFIHCDVVLKYLNYITDHQEWGYVLPAGETDVPVTFKKVMAEGNRLQDIFCGEFRAGLTGNQLLANILKKAKEQGIPNPRVYSHSLGLFLHEPGPLIGLPWEQVNNPGRGDVQLVYNSCFVAELSVTVPIPEWGGKDFRLPLEQDIAFTREGVIFLDGRQTKFHLIK